jgi:hypothetical protein
VRLPDGTADPDRVRSEFEGLIAAQLQRRGYAVVASPAFRDTWLRFTKDLGGVFDPVTGRADSEKYELAWQHTARELERTQDVDALLTAEVAFDAMPAELGFWSWQAAGQPIRWRGQTLPSAPNQQPQRVEGPYLTVRIHDRAHVPLYEVRMPLTWARVYLGGGYEEVPARELYTDPARNQKVVEQLLSGLVDRTSGRDGR